VNTGASYSFNLGTGDWSFSGSSPCPGGVSTCYNVVNLNPASVSVSSGASVSSSYSWSGSSTKVLTGSATVSNRLGPVTVTYTVNVNRYEEETLSQQNSYTCHYECYDCVEDGCYVARHSSCAYGDTCYYTSYYQDRVFKGTTSMSVSHTLLLLPTGFTVYSQPASTYTAASTTNVAVTLQLLPAVVVVSGHPFSVAMASVSESGVLCRSCATSNVFHNFMSI
jgi:hypothetical protein